MEVDLRKAIGGIAARQGLCPQVHERPARKALSRPSFTSSAIPSSSAPLPPSLISSTHSDEELVLALLLRVQRPTISEWKANLGPLQPAPAAFEGVGGLNRYYAQRG